jgi:hypothetical protein
MSSPNFNEFIEKFVQDRKQEITKLEEELSGKMFDELKKKAEKIISEIEKYIKTELSTKDNLEL